MNPLQVCQFEILKAFIEVCKTHHLQYFLVCGSALGAIRHKGFIPWDDDVDVGMPRSDYDKFINLDHPFKDDRYFLQTYKTDKNYIYNFAKIRDCKTTFVEKAYAHHQMNHGVWLDVFPLDGVSYKNDVSYKRLAYKVHRSWFAVYFMYLAAFKRKITKRTFYLDIPLNIVAFLFCLVNVGHWQNKALDRLARKIPYEKAGMIGNLFGASKEIVPRRFFGKGTHATFEGIDVIIPEDYDSYLTYLYGDYMKPPIKKKQEGHHHNKGLSLEKDYKTYCYEHRL